MRLRLAEKHEAIGLRKKGNSYSEIMEKIPNISKSTLSGWLKNIELTSVQKDRLLSKVKIGSEKSRLLGSLKNKENAERRILMIQQEAERQYRALYRNPLFKIGLCLYWAEGAKKSRAFQFINSDPEMIKLMLRWLRQVLRVDCREIKIRLFIHEIYAHENCELFWSNISGISAESFYKTVYKPTIHQHKKNPNYKGCCRLDISKSEIYWKIVRWQKMMIESL
jgi:hypothetical protein